MPFDAVKRNRSRPDKNGFSLVEAMVALGIFSLVLLLLTNGMWSGARFLTANKSSGSALEARLLAQKLVEERLGSAMVSSIDAREPSLEFTGSASTMRFFSKQKRGSEPARIERVSFSIAGGSDLDKQPGLQIEIRPLDATNNRLGKPKSSNIAVAARRFSFFNPRARGDYEKGWISQWPFVNELPPAIRMNMVQGEPILARVFGDIDTNCLQEKGNEGLSGRFCIVQR